MKSGNFLKITLEELATVNKSTYISLKQFFYLLQVTSCAELQFIAVRWVKIIKYELKMRWYSLSSHFSVRRKFWNIHSLLPSSTSLGLCQPPSFYIRRYIRRLCHSWYLHNLWKLRRGWHRLDPFGFSGKRRTFKVHREVKLR